MTRGRIFGLIVAMILMPTALWAGPPREVKSCAECRADEECHHYSPCTGDVCGLPDTFSCHQKLATPPAPAPPPPKRKK